MLITIQLHKNSKLLYNVVNEGGAERLNVPHFTSVHTTMGNSRKFPNRANKKNDFAIDS